MSYIHPNSAAAHFTFSGEALPAGPADLVWESGGALAIATGFSTTALGAPRASQPRFVEASGALSTVFGSPGQRRAQPASGIAAVGAFGAPSSARRIATKNQRAATQFGTPNSPYLLTAEPFGFAVSRYGAAFAFGGALIRTTTSLSARQFRATQFGAAAAAATADWQAESVYMGATFGPAVIGCGQSAAPGAPGSTFGLPSTAGRIYAKGFRSAAVGPPASIRAQPARGIHRATGWGVPSYLRNGAHLAQGVRAAARFGHPSARRLNAYQVSDAAHGTMFGAHSGAQRYTATSIAPVLRLGKPILTRGGQC